MCSDVEAVIALGIAGQERQEYLKHRHGGRQLLVNFNAS